MLSADEKVYLAGMIHEMGKNWMEKARATAERVCFFQMAVGCC